MALRKARDSLYTLFYFLPLRDLSGYIDLIYLFNVKRIRHIYEKGELKQVLMLLDVDEASPDARRFEALAETVMLYFTEYANEFIEIE